MSPCSTVKKQISLREFKVNPFPGFFIDIEGLDGSGQSTQIKLLITTLGLKGIIPLLTKEPNEDCYLGKEIRQILKKEKEMESPLKLQEMFVDNRKDHLKKIIIPQLKDNGVVITDRYLWSTVAYGSLDISPQQTLRMNKDFILPDITFFIKTSPQECMRRMKASRSSLEYFEELDKLKKVYETYLDLSKKFKDNIIVVNGKDKEEKIAEKILNFLSHQPKFQRLTAF